MGTIGRSNRNAWLAGNGQAAAAMALCSRPKPSRVPGSPALTFQTSKARNRVRAIAAARPAGRSAGDHHRPMAHDELEHIPRARSQSHADSGLARALLERLRHQAGDSRRRVPRASFPTRSLRRNLPSRVSGHKPCGSEYPPPRRIAASTNDGWSRAALCDNLRGGSR